MQHAAIIGLMFDEQVRVLDAIGKEAVAYAKRNTPVLTGYARRSVFYVVLDEAGAVIAGDTHDENGVPIPSYLPQHASGTLRVFVGANAPYYIWIEIGARGRAGRAVLARTAELMEQRLQAAARERRGIGAAA